MTTPRKGLKVSLKFLIKSAYAWRGERPSKTGSISHPSETYSIFLLPNLSEYAKSGSLSISSSTHRGRGILQCTKGKDLAEVGFKQQITFMKNLQLKSTNEKG